MTTKPRDPRTRAEWQEAVDLAEFFTHLDSAQKYGLVTGGPATIDSDRCLDLLIRGRNHGVRPTPGCVERLTMLYCEGAGKR